MSLVNSNISGHVKQLTKYLAVMFFISATYSACCFLLATICPSIRSYASNKYVNLFSWCYFPSLLHKTMSRSSNEKRPLSISTFRNSFYLSVLLFAVNAFVYAGPFGGSSVIKNTSAINWWTYLSFIPYEPVDKVFYKRFYWLTGIVYDMSFIIWSYSISLFPISFWLIN